MARYLFDRHGAKVIFFGRFVSVLRAYASFLAGTVRMAVPHLRVANAAGGGLGGALRLRLLPGRHGPQSGLHRRWTWPWPRRRWWSIVVAVVLVRRKMSALIEVAEAAYPGPLAP